MDLAVNARDTKGPGPVRDFLSVDEVRALQQRSRLRIALSALGAWAAILGPLALYAAYPSVWSFAFAFVVIGASQLSLTHLTHDACHYNISGNRDANDWISDVFFAAPTLISTESYRLQHMPHHAHLGDWEQDTDRRAWYNISGPRFLYRTLWALLGLEAASTILAYSKIGVPSGVSRQPWRRPLLMVITQALLLGYCYALGSPLAYFTLWIAPLFTITMYLLTLRVIAEHQTEAYALERRDVPGKSLDAPLIRTLRPGLIGRLSLGSMNFSYHHEHHLLPGVPYTQLPKLHRLLCERGYYEKYPEALGDSYLRTIARLVFPRPRQER